MCKGTMLLLCLAFVLMPTGFAQAQTTPLAVTVIKAGRLIDPETRLIVFGRSGAPGRTVTGRSPKRKNRLAKK